MTSGITQSELQWLIELIKAGREHDFYLWGRWKEKRLEVFRLDRFECQNCKAKGRYRKAIIVHHKKHLKDRPDLALSIYDEDGNRQLVSVCKQCHEEEHPEVFKKFDTVERLTVERWD